PYEIKMALSLSPECLQYILAHLEGDSKTLHSCLLVSRFWCHNAVNILWSRPWSYSISQNSATKLIQTYVTCLPDETKIILFKNGINYQIVSTPHTFDYASFLRALDYDYMCWSISQWLNSCWFYRVLNYGEEIKSDAEDRTDRYGLISSDVEDNGEFCDESEEENERKTGLVARELCKLFMKRCRTFHVLLLESKAIQSDFPFLPPCTNSRNYLTNLRQLICLGDLKSELLIAISRICKDLRRICIGFPPNVQWKFHYETDARSLATLIEKQNRLQSFCLYGYKRFVSIIIDALKHQSNSLTSLELIDTDFQDEEDYRSLSALSACQNLESIKILNCFISPSDQLFSLASFSRLEEFEFRNEWNPLYPLPQNEFWEALFQNTRHSLRKMSFWWLRSDPKDGYQIIESIAKHCSHIHFLHLPVLWMHEVFLLFNYCTQLKIFSFSGDDFDANETLIQMSMIVPATLKSLTIKDGNYGGWTFTEKSLQYFLDNSCASLEVVDLTECACMTNQHYEAISRRGITTCL
ncbi:7481_t:CDS:1, partial [Acaulospora morrowiae]